MSLSSETKRQWVHIGVGFFALLLGFINTPWGLMAAMLAFVHNVLLLPKYAPHLFRKRERILQGITVYPLVVAVLILIFSEQLVLAAGAWAILSFGDGFSTLVGKWKPIVPIPWNPEKSLGGLLGFWLFGSLGAFLIMAVVGPFPTWQHLFFASIAAALLAGMYETLPLPWDDNIITALAAAAALATVWGVDLSPALPDVTLAAVIASVMTNAVIAPLAWWFGWVSKTGAAGGFLIGNILWIIGGLHCYALLVLFFVAGTAVTRLGYHEKNYMGVAQEGHGKRGAKHALANCFFAVSAVLMVGFTDGMDTHASIVFTAAIATALADTVATELGQLYGKTPFLPTTFRTVRPGTVGAISAEGTLFGMGTSLVLAIFAFAVGIISLHAIPVVALGAWLGSFLESYIGSRWTDEGVEISNEWMNLLNTFLGGSLAVILFTVTGGL